MKKKVLIVEDEWIIGDVLKKELENIGYEVTGIAATGEDAIQNVKDNKPDVVLMDITLQGEMDGITAAKLIERYGDIPIVFLTSHSDTGTLNRVKGTNPFGYMTKPVRIREAHMLIEIAITKCETEVKLKQNEEMYFTILSGINEANRKLEEKEAWFSETLSIIGDAVITTDTKGKVTFLNPASLSLLDLEHQNAIKRHFSEIIKIVDNKTGIEIDGLVTTVINERKILHFVDHIPADKTDGKVDVTVTITPVQDKDDNILGSVFVFSDIST